MVQDEISIYRTPETSHITGFCGQMLHAGIIPHPTECFVKLNIGGAVCLLDKISLKKIPLDFSMSW